MGTVIDRLLLLLRRDPTGQAGRGPDAPETLPQQIRSESLRAAKRLVLDAPLTGAETARRIAARRASAEGQEGLRAFLEKRPPAWR